ncbi:mating-type protein MAT alpha 1 [Aspergillus saccharolyticus JOP 1030-1]|uniref:Mating-type protein MAT alpha 1 n=1 Tax=Aspergillus saccharolyticus JOP 1030-1 TaxID=1450539 RepID=A0A319ADN4_9EURO|nr:mating-type protein MAT alpha 1 [Aspergillus saccharolyticus JOP 1030-1]PYH44972.1 mating-type protein MAT alpha 1 [Aspergillus saccharolyticus JOP 1030-1]
MDDSNSPLHRAFSSFLTNMPAQQLSELLQHVQGNKTDGNTRVSHDHEAAGESSQAVLDNANASVDHRGRATQASASRAKRTPDAKRRPLNSFIAFRSFYSTMFPEITQKAKSGILRFLWQNDPFKAKWTIIAKAYSIVRDTHEHEHSVTLETFLNLNSGMIGILQPEQYLDVMGWQLVVDEQHQYTMTKVKLPSTTEEQLVTNYSVDDIVRNCYDTGYVSGGNRNDGAANSRNPAVMAFAAQPNLVVHDDSSIRINDSHTIITGDSDGSTSTKATSPDNSTELSSPASSDIVPTFEKGQYEHVGAVPILDLMQVPQSQTNCNEYQPDEALLSLWNEDGAILQYGAAFPPVIPNFDPLVYDESYETFDFDRFIML